MDSSKIHRRFIINSSQVYHRFIIDLQPVQLGCLSPVGKSLAHPQTLLQGSTLPTNRIVAPGTLDQVGALKPTWTGFIAWFFIVYVYNILYRYYKYHIIYICISQHIYIYTYTCFYRQIWHDNNIKAPLVGTLHPLKFMDCLYIFVLDVATRALGTFVFLTHCSGSVSKFSTANNWMVDTIRTPQTNQRQTLGFPSKIPLNQSIDTKRYLCCPGAGIAPERWSDGGFSSQGIPKSHKVPEIWRYPISPLISQLMGKLPWTPKEIKFMGEPPIIHWSNHRFSLVKPPFSWLYKPVFVMVEPSFFAVKPGFFIVKPSFFTVKPHFSWLNLLLMLNAHIFARPSQWLCA